MALGDFGEELATRYLVEQGYSILRRNWRSAAGEVDIVAADSELTILCEVKARHGSSRGHPTEAIGSNRLSRLAAAAECWISDHPGVTVRLDAISILLAGEGIELRHLRGIQL